MPRLLAIIERVEQGTQSGEPCITERGPQLVLDRSSGRSLCLKVVDAAGSEHHRLLPLADRRIGDRDVATITQVRDDFAGTLASDAEFASDGRDR